MTEQDEKRYYFSVVEEMLSNPDYEGQRQARIEVYDRQDPSGFAITGGSFRGPNDFFRHLYDFFRNYETDIPIYMKLNIEGD